MATTFCSAEDVDGRLAGVLGLGALKLSESSFTAMIYPERLPVSVRSCRVALDIFRDGHRTDTLGAVYMLDADFWCGNLWLDQTGCEVIEVVFVPYGELKTRSAKGPEMAMWDRGQVVFGKGQVFVMRMTA